MEVCIGGTGVSNKAKRKLIARLRRVLRHLSADLSREFRADHYESVVNQVEMHRRVHSLYRRAFDDCFPVPDTLAPLFAQWYAAIMIDVADNAQSMSQAMNQLKSSIEGLDEGLFDLRNELLRANGSAVAPVVAPVAPDELGPRE